MPGDVLRCLGKCARWFPKVVPGAVACFAHIDSTWLAAGLAARGFVAKIAILWTLGVIVVVIGAILLPGMAGHAVGGRRHYF